MPTIHAHAEGPAAPDAVVAALTDFSDKRLERWPNLRDRYILHAQGDGWADVTEGSTALGRAIRERGRYEWSTGVVRFVVAESTIRQPGSTWEWRVAPTSEGSRLDFPLVPPPRGGVGRLR